MPDEVKFSDLPMAPVPAFDQSANSTTALTVPAAVNVGSLTLLTDAITAIGTLQTAVNTNRQLINKIIDILQNAKLAQ